MWHPSSIILLLTHLRLGQLRQLAAMLRAMKEEYLAALKTDMKKPEEEAFFTDLFYTGGRQLNHFFRKFAPLCVLITDLHFTENIYYGHNLI